ncbi:acetylglutamate kinase [Halobacillus yeomjeoni]|uniref:acetylglutamate kinase n=1 Tax=Halobacillus yeomjeoni TaxID=311194 RepID=UPI001CD6198D|nr:acetylglutamate kinase [Halobacillus yeomjeoni]MCA0985276.1 acetylglutamate kinase [Halobacillus yeomjeoni]
MITSKSTQATEHKTKPVVVVKLGGSMISRLSEKFYESFSELMLHYHVIIVHGGGPAITRMMDKLGVSGEFHQGLRKTNEETLEIVEMALCGKVNGEITSRLAAEKINALGMKGSDASILTARFIDQENLGFVGEVEEVNADILYRLLQAGYLPVLAPLGKTITGQTVNINADLSAAAVAKAVNAEKLIYVTDVPGILRGEEVIERITPEEINTSIDEGWIYGGMIPKVQSAMEALSDQLKEVMIVSGEHALISNQIMNGTTIQHKSKEGVE